MSRVLFLFLLLLSAVPAHAARSARPAITSQAVNEAQWSGTVNDRRGAFLLKAQVLLDRAGFHRVPSMVVTARIMTRPCALFSEQRNSNPPANLTEQRGTSSSTHQIIRYCTNTRSWLVMWQGRS
jgi:hypothetical protein